MQFVEIWFLQGLPDLLPEDCGSVADGDGESTSSLFEV